MHANKPPVVARLGRSAFRISLSGLALSSLRQKAISSQIAATAVTPRIVRKDAGLTSMSTPLANLSVSTV